MAVAEVDLDVLGGVVDRDDEVGVRAVACDDLHVERQPAGVIPASVYAAAITGARPSMSSLVETYQPEPAPCVWRVTAGLPAAGPSTYVPTTCASCTTRSSCQTSAVRSAAGSPSGCQDTCVLWPARNGRNSSTVTPSASRSGERKPPGCTASCSSTTAEKYETTSVPPAST